MAYYQQGKTYNKLKEYQKAINSFNKVLEINPNNAKAYLKRGIAYFNLKGYKNAILSYD